MAPLHAVDSSQCIMHSWINALHYQCACQKHKPPQNMHFLKYVSPCIWSIFIGLYVDLFIHPVRLHKNKQPSIIHLLLSNSIFFTHRFFFFIPPSLLVHAWILEFHSLTIIMELCMEQTTMFMLVPCRLHLDLTPGCSIILGTERLFIENEQSQRLHQLLVKVSCVLFSWPTFYVLEDES